ncbi:CLUMA_CG001923, isoform A [Clunio marinus]|uniref:CLUMA_CG001923, isoform A n=1 Tax=Clunio marinus TaxID=568069 RepID=A0A1J1HKS6_9DIPT|nr:CLUMA_CG001923, isoform A [Clunio marinus]
MENFRKEVIAAESIVDKTSLRDHSLLDSVAFKLNFILLQSLSGYSEVRFEESNNRFYVMRNS